MSTRETRARIVRATRELHEAVGPAATTISGIAERAGVQRLTVYRHFPDERSLVSACSADWAADHPLPEPTWSGESDPRARLTQALDALYVYFRGGAPMLARVLRDEAEVPALAEAMVPWWEAMHEIAGALAAGWGTAPADQRLLRSAVRHAVRFETWRSLTDGGLADREAVAVMVRWIAALADGAGDGSHAHA